MKFGNLYLIYWNELLLKAPFATQRFIHVPGVVARGMAMGVANRIATIGLSFLATLLLARVLGAEGFGLYAFALSIAAILGRFAGLGLPELIIRLTASAENAARTPTLRGVLRFA